MEAVIGVGRSPGRDLMLRRFLQSFANEIPQFLSPSGKRLSDREWRPLKGSNTIVQCGQRSQSHLCKFTTKSFILIEKQYNSRLTPSSPVYLYICVSVFVFVYLYLCICICMSDTREHCLWGPCTRGFSKT